MAMQANARGSFRQVLVVDDEGALQLLVRAVLEQERYMVDVARDGQEACERIKHCSYDAIVCDILMPNMDGITFYGILKDTDAQLADRVIFITGADAYTSVNHQIYGQPMLRKPFDIDELERIVASVACQPV